MKLSAEDINDIKKIINDATVIRLLETHEVEDVLYLFKSLHPEVFKAVSRDHGILDDLVKYKFRNTN